MSERWYCGECGTAHQILDGVSVSLFKLDRDAARADADRLAAAVRVLLVVQTKLREKTLDSDGVARFEGFTWTTAFDALCAALAAHDAARTEEPTVGDDLAVLAVAERAQVIEWLRTHHDGFAEDGRWMHVGNVLRRLCLAAPGDDTAHDAARTKEGPNGFAIEDLCDADD